MLTNWLDVIGKAKAFDIFINCLILLSKNKVSMRTVVTETTHVSPLSWGRRECEAGTQSLRTWLDKQPTQVCGTPHGIDVAPKEHTCTSPARHQPGKWGGVQIRWCEHQLPGPKMYANFSQVLFYHLLQNEKLLRSPNFTIKLLKTSSLRFPNDSINLNHRMN